VARKRPRGNNLFLGGTKRMGCSNWEGLHFIWFRKPKDFSKKRGVINLFFPRNWPGPKKGVNGPESGKYFCFLRVGNTVFQFHWESYCFHTKRVWEREKGFFGNFFTQGRGPSGIKGDIVFVWRHNFLMGGQHLVFFQQGWFLRKT